MAVVEPTSDNFEEKVTNIVDFWAPWYGPCRSFSPTYERASEEHLEIVFAKVNTEKEKNIAAYFHIRSIPALLIFREKGVIFSQAGALSEPGFKELIERAGELDSLKYIRKS